MKPILGILLVTAVMTVLLLQILVVCHTGEFH